MAFSSDSSNILMDRVADWLMQTALAGGDLETLVRGFCNRLAASGLPLARIHLSFSMLHPLFRAMGFTWRRKEGLKVEGYRHVAEGQTDLFKRSPYFYLLENDLDHLRRHLNTGDTGEFSIFEDLRKEGMTDYFAFASGFKEDSTQGMLGSWATDNESGFSDADIAALLRIQNHLAVATRMAVLGQLAGNMLTTYLGSGAGKRVLSGQIQRGDGETIRAALIMADMRKSTALAERDGRQVFIDTLNQFFDALAGPFAETGAEILSFLGDGFLAVFPCARHRGPSEIACRAALSTARNAVARMALLNLQRRQQNLDEIGFGIGLHIGNVMFGNVGLKDRLTFSAFGSAVNEVQRLESLTKKYPAPVIASEAFVDYCGGEWTELGTESLKGVKDNMTVFAPAALAVQEGEATVPAELPGGILTDAEQLVLLHRALRKAQQAVPQKKSA
ncbi:adenylate/guanylate cyclase domain-containing protein [soil metagenome]